MQWTSVCAEAMPLALVSSATRDTVSPKPCLRVASDGLCACSGGTIGMAPITRSCATIMLMSRASSPTFFARVAEDMTWPNETPPSSTDPPRPLRRPSALLFPFFARLSFAARRCVFATSAVRPACLSCAATTLRGLPTVPLAPETRRWERRRCGLRGPSVDALRGCTPRTGETENDTPLPP